MIPMCVAPGNLILPSFAIHNPEWKEELDSLLLEVKDELGCDLTRNVSCQLYKLLLYEPGGFFKVYSYDMIEYR